MEDPPVGSLVVPSPKYRDAMGLGEGAALLLALRRGSGKLFYPSLDRTYWVPMNDVRGIPPEAVPENSLERLLSELLLLLNTEECEVEAYEDRTMNLNVESPSLSREELSELESRYEGVLESIDFAPRNMSRIMLRLHLVLLPEAATTGT